MAGPQVRYSSAMWSRSKGPPKGVHTRVGGDGTQKMGGRQPTHVRKPPFSLRSHQPAWGRDILHSGSTDGARFRSEKTMAVPRMPEMINSDVPVGKCTHL